MLERFERQRRGTREFDVWDAQGWYGGDYRKLWLKTEGRLQRAGSSDDAELQALYSRAIAPFWDWQMGVRLKEGSGPSRQYAVLGLQGLAPYWFEVDTALFLDDRSHVQFRVDADYDLRLTQRWILQPRLQFNYAFASDRAAGVEKGSSDSSVALRLRFEVIREMAPYVGIERDLGGRRHGKETRVVAGIRLWY
jgi:copper resistance protein B